jgi:hypothetical protein
MNRFYLGLDLGQASDYSALAILESQPQAARDSRTFHCRHLQRWPLRTSYPAIVADMARIVASDDLQQALRRFNGEGHHGSQFGIENQRQATMPVLAIDATGVGAPVVDMFKVQFKDSIRDTLSHASSVSGLKSTRGGAAPRRSTPAATHWPQSGVVLKPIQITGGDAVTYEGGVTRVPKRDLVSAAQVALQTGGLKIASDLPEAQALVRELENFQMKISLDTAHDSYGAWREGAHDDLVLAVALALWCGMRASGRLVTW